MATTAIWDVKGWLGKIVIYVENPEKTENPKYYEKQNTTNEQSEGLSDVIGYAMREDATVSEELHERFVSGINCSINTARTEMMAVKKRYGKEDGTVAFHGYQSFAPNEATPKIAHEIGIRLAEELWGDRFQVIVATHLDKENHIHNHFVLNSVSFKDGYRYNDCTKTYMLMRKTSDRLCKEFGLSVIEDPKRGKAKHYGEWKAEQNGRPTWRGIIKSDVDEAISKAVTDRQFFYLLRQKGYTIKQGKDITVRPQGKERGMKLARNLGDEYTYEAICQKILANTYRTPPISQIDKKMIVFKLHDPLKKQKSFKGIRALYIQYCFKLGILPKGNTISQARLHFLLKEDLAKLDNINKETRLLCVNKIETYQQLFLYQNSKQKQLDSFIEQRKHLRYKLRANISDDKKQSIKVEITTLNKDIKELRKEVVLCSNIAERSQVIKEKLKIINEDERKEEPKIEHRRRSSRSGH
ncbi:relaxase/mobilization nuclease domain-containing protein [Thomasclavelia sp.]